MACNLQKSQSCETQGKPKDLAQPTPKNVIFTSDTGSQTESFCCNKIITATDKTQIKFLDQMTVPHQC